MIGAERAQHVRLDQVGERQQGRLPRGRPEQRRKLPLPAGGRILAPQYPRAQRGRWEAQVTRGFDQRVGGEIAVRGDLPVADAHADIIRRRVWERHGCMCSTVALSSGETGRPMTCCRAAQNALVSIMTAGLPLNPDALAALCGRHRIRRLSLFGSVLKGTDRPDSDIDLLVEFEPGATLTYFDLADIEQELSALLGGRRVDVRTPEELSRYFRDEVVREAEVQYESA